MSLGFGLYTSYSKSGFQRHLRWQTLGLGCRDLLSGPVKSAYQLRRSWVNLADASVEAQVERDVRPVSESLAPNPQPCRLSVSRVMLTRLPGGPARRVTQGYTSPTYVSLFVCSKYLVEKKACLNSSLSINDESIKSSLRRLV